MANDETNWTAQADDAKTTALKTAFLDVAKKLGVYFAATGSQLSHCDADTDGAAVPDTRVFSFNYVPEKARRGLEKALGTAGLQFVKTDGPAGEGAYYHVQADGVSEKQLKGLGVLIEAEVKKATGKTYDVYAAEVARKAQGGTWQGRADGLGEQVTFID